MENPDLIPLPVPLPPMLPSIAQVTGENRYFAIFYLGSKATWNDGRSLGSFSYYAVYQPLIEHPALAIHLEGYHLGSDDKYPTHSILCDRNEQKMFVGNYTKIEKFLANQHSPIPLHTSTLELDFQAVNELFDIEQFQKLGMFELFIGHSELQKQSYIKLVQWLDSLITEELLQQYIEAANKENWLAISVLRKLQQRMEPLK